MGGIYAWAEDALDGLRVAGLPLDTEHLSALAVVMQQRLHERVERLAALESAVRLAFDDHVSRAPGHGPDGPHRPDRNGHCDCSAVLPVQNQHAGLPESRASDGG